jgi:UDP-glucose 4-epimerase
LIPYVIKSLLRGEAPRLGSGVRLVDWIYIDDVVEGLVRCAEAPGVEGRTVELGSGEMFSIREVVQLLSELVPTTAHPQFGSQPDRPLERVKKADIAESYRLISWRPPTALRVGLGRTVEWYKNQSETC